MAKPRLVPHRAAHLLLLLPLLFSSLAQDLPSIQLDDRSYEVGEEVALQVGSLTPEEEYLLTIEGPNAQATEERLTADSEGSLRHTFEVDAAGEWSLRLEGEGLNASLTLDVTGGEESQAAPEQQAGQPAEDSEEQAPGGEADEQAAAAEQPADEEAADEPVAQGQGAEPEESAAQAEEEAQSEEVAEEEAGGDPEAQDDEPVEEQPQEQLSFSADGDAVVAMRGDDRAWRFDFPDGSGGTGAVLETGDGIWIGHGNSAILVERETGRARARYAMPGRIVRLEPAGDAVSVVSDVDGNLRQRIEVDDEGPRSPVRFGTELELFEWLRNEAQVPDPGARLELDPTNPWLHLRVGLASSNAERRRQRLEDAVERGSTFYDLAGIARELQEAGELELAGEAMDRALEDFADRGYDPELLASPQLHHAYDFPVAPMEEALDSADLEAAEFWAPWVYLLSSSETPETRAVLLEYSRQLAAVGQRDAAALWRDRATAGRSDSPAGSLDRFFLGLGRSGWYAVAAMLAAILALHVTLTAKYWAPHSLAIKRSRETAGRKRPWSRLFAIRYYSFTEKLVLVLLFAACLALLGLTRWYDAAGERPPALASGTLASPVARDVVSSSPLDGPRGAFIEGYAAQMAGEEAAARTQYVEAGDYPPALNNLAALLDNDALYQRALELAPGMPEASYNLGRATDPSPFHANYRPDEPLLAVPGAGDFRTAISGSWQRAVGATFENPWRALRGMDFMAVPQIVWQIGLALFLLWVLVTVIWLVIPRPALARNAPRTVAYHLLALLIPGSGLADEAWGVLLMVPWALLGVDALAQWLGWERSLGLPLETGLWSLAAIYVVNLIAFVVEYLSYRKRMRELRRRHPEAVEAYGLNG